MRRWIGALGILVSALFVISLSVTSHLIVTGLGAAGEVAAFEGLPENELPPGVTIFPTDDSMVVEGYPDEVADGGTLYNMYNGYVPLVYLSERCYLKFDLSDIDPEELDNAFLLANSKYGPSRAPGRTDTWHLVDAHPVEDDDWDETTITWNNAPPPGATVLDTENFKADSYWVGDPRAGDPESGQRVWYLWDVTSFVQSQLADDHIVSICLVRENEGVFDPNTSSDLESGGWFYTKDGEEHKPHLYLVGVSALGVDLSVNYPENRIGMPGGTLYHRDIIIKNTGSVPDNYDLSVSDTEGWGAENLGVSPSSVGPLESGESTRVTTWATIPPGTAPGTVNYIIVTATSQENAEVSDSDNWDAQVSADRLGSPEHDSHVRNTENYLGDNLINRNLNTTHVRLESYSGDAKNARVFLKWDLNGLPPEDQIAKAELYLWCYLARNDDVDAQIYSVDDDSWLENEITWNNQPAHVDVLDTVTLTAWPTTVENTWISWDVTPYVAGQRLIDNTASFCIRAEAENVSGLYFFDAKDYGENENARPYLKITLGPDNYDVSVSISPVHRIGNIYNTVTYDVKVMNTGNVTDSYTLSKTDDEDWTMTLTPSSFANVPPGESRTATLSVTLSSTQGAEDSIQVTASGTGVSDNENCTASVKRVGRWEVAGYAPRIDNYGVAVTGVGSGSYIYVANSNTLGTRVSFMRYDTDTGEWDYRAAPPVSSPFKNGTVLAWDGGDYIYALCGGSYDDVAENSRARHYFYRYKISTNEWENLMPTGNTDNENNNTGAQGAGDAMAIDLDHNKIYAIVGQNEIDSSFWLYDIATDTWAQLTLNWASTDDGCSLVWTGGDYLYALRGEWQETTPSKEFARYHITFPTGWESRAEIPEPGGVGDGASLLWIEGDNIYATGGSRAYEQAATEGLDDNFYVYSIPGNSWEQLEDLPAGIGAQNGPRLGAGSDIYCWRGCGDDSVLWVYSFPPPWMGTAVFSLVNLYTVNVEKILYLENGSKLVVKFYDYGDVYENENVIETFTTPPTWHVEDNELARHPEGIGVKKARLVLTTADTSNELGDTIASFTVRRVDLETRFSKIPSAWFLAPPGSQERTDLETEFSKIPSAWFLAPP